MPLSLLLFEPRMVLKIDLEVVLGVAGLVFFKLIYNLDTVNSSIQYILLRVLTNVCSGSLPKTLRNTFLSILP